MLSQGRTLLLVTDAQAGEVVLDTVAEHPQVVAVRPVLVQQRQQGPVHLGPEPDHVSIKHCGEHAFFLLYLVIICLVVGIGPVLELQL